MIDADSRYAHLEKVPYVEDGRTIMYLRRRFLPRGKDLPVLAEVDVRPGDRLDLIAMRVLGDPSQGWQICDANDVLDPKELTRSVGRRLRIPIPQFREPEAPRS